jgi:hypothetical protein
MCAFCVLLLVFYYIVPKESRIAVSDRDGTFEELSANHCDYLYANLTFMGPCFMIYFHSKTNWMHNFRVFFNITLHVSDVLSVYHQEFNTVHTASVASGHEMEHLVPASKQSANLYDIPDVVCTVLTSWWWTERPSETCIHFHLVVCLTTGPKPLPKRALHIVRSRASSFKW